MQNQIIAEKMKKLIIYSVMVFSIVGCASVDKEIVAQHRKDIRISVHENGSLLINMVTPSFEWDKKGVIDLNRSYAIDANGIKYTLTSEAFRLAHNCPKPTTFTSDFVWLLSPANEVKMAWYNSVWTIHIMLQSDRGVEIFEHTFELKDL